MRIQSVSRYLDRSTQPVYIVDDLNRIVFANQATAEWTGYATEELVGKLCRFHSGLEAVGADAVACRLCPPPAVQNGGQAVCEVLALPSAAGDVRRRVRFVPFKIDDADAFGVLAVAEEPLWEAPAGLLDDSADAASLHERIQRLRNRFRKLYHIDRLLGDHPAMWRVREQVAVAAGSRASVLIIGPSGSGREHVARAIQTSDSQAANAPLVPLACALVGTELLRSTVAALLRRESSTGPAPATLLLNDLDQLPPADQADLPSLISAAAGRIRFLSTARARLVDLAAQGKFLTLAAHQLSTLTIELPSLRERRGDLPLLAQLFLERANARGSKQVSGFEEEALDLLAAYPWTRDLDELEQIVGEAHAACAGAIVSATDLPASLRLAQDALARPRREEETIVLDEFLAGIELELIQRAMTQAKGNKTKAAQLLGASRPRLYRRLVQLGLVAEGDSAEFIPESD